MLADNDYTYQGLLEELRTAYESHSGSRPDDASDAGIRLRVLAGQLFALHSRISWIQRQFFPSTATGAQLDQLAAMWGLARKEASFAEGMLQFARPEAETLPEIQLPSGILCAAPGTQGKQFITLESSALPEGSRQLGVLFLEGEDSQDQLYTSRREYAGCMLWEGPDGTLYVKLPGNGYALARPAE